MVSFSNFDSDAIEKFVVKLRLSDKAGLSFGTSKHEAKDDLEAGLAPPLKRACTITVKREVKKSLSADEVPPPVITFEGQGPEARVLVSCFPFYHV